MFFKLLSHRSNCLRWTLKTVNKFICLLRLYRADVAILVFFGTLAGRILTTELSFIHFVQATFISFFLYNFVYTLNAITDLREDSVNKPWRPLPSGSVNNREAFLWLSFLTLASATFIPVLFNGVEIFLAYLIMFLGMSYSIPPFAFKKRPFLAPVITGWGIVHPLILTGKTEIASITISLLIHGFATTFLKDLSDIKGDRKAGRKSVLDVVSLTHLVLISGILNIFSTIGFFISDYKAAAVIPATSFITINYEYIFRRDLFSSTIYKKAVRSTVILSVLVTIYYSVIL